MRFQKLGAFVADVQVHTVHTVLLHFKVDGASHHIARGQFFPRVVLGHEAGSTGLRRQQQLAAFTAHGFGDEIAFGLGVVQAGGVELDELHVGHSASGAPGGGNAVAGGGVGVGGVEVHLARAARGQDGVGGVEGHDLVAHLVQCVHTLAAHGLAGAGQGAGGAAVGDEVDQHVVFEHRHVGRGFHPFDERFLHRRAGGVGGVHDAAVAVPAFSGEVQFTVFG